MVQEKTERFSIPTDEQETVIQIGRNGSEVSIWTSDTTMMTKLDKLVEKSPENYKLKKIGRLKNSGATVDKEYIIADKGLLSFRAARIVRELTDEQKVEMAERLKRNTEHK